VRPDTVFDWFYSNETLAWWLLLISIVSFIGTIMLVPVILSCIPADYFTPAARRRMSRNRPRFLLLLPLWIIKNTLAILFILAGVLMLALPGQGILTILVGLVLLDFPGKYRLERRLISIPSVHRGVDWIREKAGKAPLELDD